MTTHSFWYLLSAPAMLAGFICIAVGLFAGCVLVVERRNPFNLATLTLPRIIAGAMSLVVVGVLCEIVALRLVE